jgi:hypothetical protein
MPEPKTKPTEVNVDSFLAAVPDEGRRRDGRALVALMREVTGEEPRMWGPSIVGFGRYTLKYESGRSAEWPVACFAPRKQALTVYLSPEFPERDRLLSKLGPYKTGVSCLYIKRLSDVDTGVLKELVSASVAHVRATHDS